MIIGLKVNKADLSKKIKINPVDNASLIIAQPISDTGGDLSHLWLMTLCTFRKVNHLLYWK